MRIALVEMGDIDRYLEHLERQRRESGRDGAPIFAPYSSSTPFEAQGHKDLVLLRWHKPLEESGWERAFAVHDQEMIVGHLELRADSLPSMRHRARLGIGLERAYRNQGLGLALLKTAIAWARERLCWLDLGVFAHNEPARRLYAKCGFVQAGYVTDMFRVDGQSIDDIHMVLALK